MPITLLFSTLISREMGLIIEGDDVYGYFSRKTLRCTDVHSAWLR